MDGVKAVVQLVEMNGLVSHSSSTLITFWQIHKNGRLKKRFGVRWRSSGQHERLQL